MKIGIVGAGAIGGLIGTRLGAAGHDVSVFARGETLHASRGSGWRLDSSTIPGSAAVLASDYADDLGPQDILVLAPKGPSLPGLVRRIRPMIGKDTVVIPAMNGVPWWFLLAG